MVCFSLLLFATCGGQPETPVPETGWSQDIQWIADSLPLIHYDLFMYVPRDSLISRLESLEDSLEFMEYQDVAMELTRILASMNCSHTGLAFWDRCLMVAYPVSVIWLDDGLYLTGIDREHSELIGSRLIAYDGRPAMEAAQAMAEMFPATNEISQRTSAERYIMLASCMESLGYGTVSGPVEFTMITPQGDTVSVQYQARGMDYSGMESFQQGDSLPLWLSSNECYWYRYLPGMQMLYCAYNSCSVMDDYSFQQYVDDLRRTVEEEDVSFLVIDLRRNGGGNSMIAAPLVQWLEEISGDVSINLIIGRWTYSSGILNSLEISRIPGVTVYGESTSGAPNHLGEVRTAQLPYSGLTVSYPTKYFQSVEGPGRTMEPDVCIPLSPEMLFQGENRILQAIYDTGGGS